ncbi:MAG: CDP-alcohol phosphatidyltransferase family protein [Saprospiraceae bacterium]|nr:CDP-alcohol phosphatidyltransferase family protein [Saprospiraceae bacterium]
MNKSIIPNLITATNLFCGCLVLICLLSGNNLDWVPLLMTIALLSDYVDGLVARLLKAYSELGKQLDSLADMVSFGVIPGVMLYYMLSLASGTVFDVENSDTWINLVGFSVTIFSCLRLAKFNLDDRQSDTFIGLGTPASTILIAGVLVIVMRDSYGLRDTLLNIPLLVGLSFTVSYLLIAELPMFSFKFKHLKWKGNAIRFSFLAVSLIAACFLPLGVAASLCIISYILLSVILWVFGIVKYKREHRTST